MSALKRHIQFFFTLTVFTIGISLIKMVYPPAIPFGKGQDGFYESMNMKWLCANRIAILYSYNQMTCGAFSFSEVLYKLRSVGEIDFNRLWLTDWKHRSQWGVIETVSWRWWELSNNHFGMNRPNDCNGLSIICEHYNRVRFVSYELSRFRQFLYSFSDIYELLAINSNMGTAHASLFNRLSDRCLSSACGLRSGPSSPTSESDGKSTKDSSDATNNHGDKRPLGSFLLCLQICLGIFICGLGVRGCYGASKLSFSDQYAIKGAIFLMLSNVVFGGALALFGVLLVIGQVYRYISGY